MRKSARLFLGVFSVIVLSFILYPLSFSQSYADISSCSVDAVSPNSVDPSETGFNFTFTNNDNSNTVQWVKVSRRSTKFDITGGSAGGWTLSNTTDAATFTGGSLNANSSGSFFVNATSNTGGTVSTN